MVGPRGEASREEDITPAEAAEVLATPEGGAADATAVIEARDAADPEISKWARAKEYFKGKAKGALDGGWNFTKEEAKKFVDPKENWNALKGDAGFAIDSTRIGLFTAFKVLWGAIKYAGQVILKKGKTSFKEGFTAGQEAVSFENKGGKK
jgi:hypothetical protein